MIHQPKNIWPSTTNAEWYAQNKLLKFNNIWDISTKSYQLIQSSYRKAKINLTLQINQMVTIFGPVFPPRPPSFQVLLPKPLGK